MLLLQIIMSFQVILFSQVSLLLTSCVAALLCLHNFTKYVDTSSYSFFLNHLIACKLNYCYIMMLVQSHNHVVASDHLIFWSCFIFSSQSVACNHANCVIASRHFVFWVHFIFWYQNNLTSHIETLSFCFLKSLHHFKSDCHSTDIIIQVWIAE